jgi:peptidylprolyl isomerase
MVAALAAVLLMAGCQSGGETLPSLSPMPEISELDQKILSLITWGQDESGIPMLLFEPPLDVLEPAVRVVWEGDGPEIDEGDPIMFHFVVFNGQDGSVVDSTYERGETESMIVSPDTAETTLYEALIEAKEGAQLIYATPGSYATADADSTETPTPTGANILAISIELVAELPGEASGTPVPPVEGLPEITFDDDGIPSAAIPETEPPAEQVTQELIEGAGQPVEEGQTVAARYAGWVWATGAVFDSNWTEEAPAVLPLDGVVEGWKNGIVGHKVGSRVLTIVPPALGYGGAGNEAVPPGSTLVFVTDILAAY